MQVLLLESDRQADHIRPTTPRARHPRWLNARRGDVTGLTTTCWQDWFVVVLSRMKTLEEVEHDALELPVSARVLLAEQLLDSLDQPDQKRLETLWATEIEQRLSRFERGETKAIPGEEVFRQIRSRHRQ
jgi:putative addiction module component (TIGR02574 family)